MQLMNSRDISNSFLNKIASQINISDSLLDNRLFDSALDNYLKILELVSSDDNPDIYAYLNNSIGICYLGKSLDRNEQYLKKSIVFFDESLKTYFKIGYPNSIANVNNNLGIAYYKISQIRSKENNLMKALKYYRNALINLNERSRSTNISFVKNNIALAHRSMLDVIPNKSPSDAIESFEKAISETSNQYYKAIMKNNMGETYAFLGLRTYLYHIPKDKTANLKKAKSLFSECLEILNIETYPEEYASEINNLANIYIYFSEINKNKEEAQLAIRLFQNAMRIYNKKSFPFKHASLQRNLGIAYVTHATLNNNDENDLEKSIQLYDEALIIFQVDKAPIDYAITQINIGNVFELCFKIENNFNNLEKARYAYSEAFRIFRLFNHPEIFAYLNSKYLDLLLETKPSLKRRREEFIKESSEENDNWKRFFKLQKNAGAFMNQCTYKPFFFCSTFPLKTELNL